MCESNPDNVRNSISWTLFWLMMIGAVMWGLMILGAVKIWEWIIK